MPADIITNIVATLPNLAVALWVLWRDDKRITALLESQRWLIEQLMALSPPQPSQAVEDGKEETH
jgi:hypothetical protein